MDGGGTRPYEIVVLSDHGQTQGAIFRQRNGYGLAEYVERSLQAHVAHLAAGDENDLAVAQALREATGAPRIKPVRETLGAAEVVVLASGNLGLIYLMEQPRRLTREEIDARYPALIPALRRHPDIGFLLVHAAAGGPVVLGAHGEQHARTGAVAGEDPLAPFPATARHHLLRTDAFTNVADIVVNSSYDPILEEACAFEELISFHGGMGGPQTAPFLLHPVCLAAPTTPIIGAEAAHRVLLGWRRQLQGGGTTQPRPRHEAGPSRAATRALDDNL